MFNRRQLRPSAEERKGRERQLSYTKAVEGSQRQQGDFFHAVENFAEATGLNRLDPEYESPQKRDNQGKTVTFDTVDVQTYASILSNNPGGAKGGAPIGIDWNVVSKEKLSLEDYEKTQDRRPFILNMRTKEKIALMRMSKETRERMLLHLGYSPKDIVQAEHRAEEDRALRRASFRDTPPGYRQEQERASKRAKEERQLFLDEYQALKKKQKAESRRKGGRLVRGFFGW